MRGTRHQNSSAPGKPGSTGGLSVPGLRRNDTGGDRARTSYSTTPVVVRDPENGSYWTTGGFPVVLLWLPYTALTALLLGLMLASFIRFHRKRLRKFRSRKEQLWRQLDVQEFLEEQRQELQPPNGNLLPAAILPRPSSPVGGDSASRKNHRQTTGNGRRKNTSLEALQHDHYNNSHRQVSLRERRFDDVAPRKVSLVASRGSSHQVSLRVERVQDETRRKTSPTTTAAAVVPEVTRSGGERRPRVRRPTSGTGNEARKRNSVVFITNINGSMVNLRCGEPDALDPFQGRRCFWAHGDRGPSPSAALCQPVRTVVEPPCLRYPAASSAHRPAVWTTAFSYDPEMEHEQPRKTRFYD